MATDGITIDELLGNVGGKDYRLKVDFIWAENEDYIEITKMEVIATDTKESLCNVKLKATVTNPIEFGAVAIAAATEYGACVGIHCFVSACSIIKESYEESKKNSPEIKRWERCRDTVKLIDEEKRTKFKDEARKALLACFAHSLIKLLGGP